MKKLFGVLILSLITLACTFGLIACECKHEFTNYLSDNNATYEADGTKTAVCDKGCGTTNTIADIGTKLESKVTYDFEIIDGTANITVANDVEEYDFNTVITKVGLSNFVVGLDKNGTQTSLTKKVDLIVGDNTFYVFETLNGDVVKTIKVIINRETKKYTVTFEGISETKIVEEGGLVTLPVEPTKPGYIFDSWDFDFTTPITGDIKISAKWSAIFNLNGNTITGLTSHGRTLTEIVIPESIDGIKIAAIGDEAFYDCDSLTNISIPNSVTSIGYSAFYGCHSLTSITIPNSVTSIGERAFWGCSSLTSITIPNSVISIGSNAFNGCNSLTSIIVDENNQNYKSIDGNLYTKDGKTLIQYAIGKTAKEFIIPNSVTDIGDYAFRNCSSLTSITIPDSVTSIGSYTFYYCRSLTSITIGNSVTSIGDSAFSACSSLTNISIPNSVTSIGYEVFRSCSSLTSITIPDSVTSIGSSAFYGCDSLTSITIPDSVTSMGDGAFEYCYSLTSVTIGDSVTSIGEYAFYYCDSLTSVTIGNSVTSIGVSAFYDCDSLTSITIGDSVTSIGNFAFSKCDSLTSITIPNSVTSIGERAFSDCDSLTSVTIGNSVTSIGSYAFYGCRSLTNMYFNGDVNKWVEIEGLSNLMSSSRTLYINNQKPTEIVLDTATKINPSAFYGCDSLTRIIIPNSVTSIGAWAFYDCLNLTIYCEATSKPSGWSSGWNSSCPVVWGYVKDNSDTNVGGVILPPVDL